MRTSVAMLIVAVDFVEADLAVYCKNKETG